MEQGAIIHLSEGGFRLSPCSRVFPPQALAKPLSWDSINYKEQRRWISALTDKGNLLEKQTPRLELCRWLTNLGSYLHSQNKWFRPECKSSCNPLPRFNWIGSRVASKFNIISHMEETFGQQMGLGLEETLSGAMRYSQCSALSFASPGGVGYVAVWGLVTSCCPCRTSSPPLPSAWARLVGHMYSFPPVWDQTFGLVNAVLRNSFLMYISIIHLCIHKNINYLWT